MTETPKVSKTLKTRLAPDIPTEHRAAFAEMVSRENARRLVWAFAVGAVTHILNFWIGWQRMEQGLFEQEPVYRWIFYNQLAWWLIAWLPIEFVRNRSRIRSGQYPHQRLKLLCTIGILWGWAFPVMNAAAHFRVNYGLGYFSVVMIVISLFILPVKGRLWLLLVSTLVMVAAIYLEADLTLLQKRFWATSAWSFSLITFLLSTIWHNNMVRQFLDKKMLESQKRQIAEQAEALSEKNRVIEQDKAQLTLLLEAANNQLNNFALRFAQKKNFLDALKTDLSSLATPVAADANKKNRILGKINLEMDGESDWEQFREHFEQANPRFFSAILAQFPTLNANELRLIALLKMNLGTQEIAAILHITPQSLNTARYRLRKRLGLGEKDDLHLFVHRFG